MEVRKFALVSGWIMLLTGVFALIPMLSDPSAQLVPLNLEESYGQFLGLVPMNILNKLALILLGVAGILLSSYMRGSIYFARTVAIVSGVLAVLGLFNFTNTLFGYWPLYGGDVFLHAVMAGFGAYFGYSFVAHGTPRAHSV